MIPKHDVICVNVFKYILSRRGPPPTSSTIFLMLTNNQMCSTPTNNSNCSPLLDLVWAQSSANHQPLPFRILTTNFRRRNWTCTNWNQNRWSYFRQQQCATWWLTLVVFLFFRVWHVKGRVVLLSIFNRYEHYYVSYTVLNTVCF